jgi:choloylglycine hydrolase
MNTTLKAICIIVSLIVMKPIIAFPCTGITLKSKDGGVVVSRTVEWALNDAQHNKILIVPRNKAFVGQTPEGYNGKSWKGEYGFVTLTAYNQNYGPDGMNEKGLYVGVYYLPGFAEYSIYDPNERVKSMSVGDLMQWMLSSFKSVDEVIAELDKVIVVDVKNEEFGGAALPFHFKITDSSGNSRIIEMVNKGEVKIYQPYLGVITNSPTYDWHLINMRNYIQLSPNPQQTLKVDNFELSPLGGGSGMMGLPGDFTPPSRFIRAAAFTASARTLPTSLDAVFESFRILDNFNIPLGVQVPSANIPADIVSATQITTASDLKEKVFYYHTMWNREIRKIDLKQIDFATVREQVIDDDQEKSNRTKDITAFLAGDPKHPADCTGLKGHAWSVIKNRCINVVETGTAFPSYDAKTGATDSGKPAYVVLSDDKLKAEVFFGLTTDKPIVMAAQPTMEGETRPVIFENKTEMVKIRYYKDAYHILYQDEIRYVQPYSTKEGLGLKLNNL